MPKITEEHIKIVKKSASDQVGYEIPISFVRACVPAAQMIIDYLEGRRIKSAKQFKLDPEFNCLLRYGIETAAATYAATYKASTKNGGIA